MAAPRLIFMGTPDYAVPALEALLMTEFQIVAVYCQPPRPAGRGKQPRPSAVQRCAEAAGLMVRMPVSLKDPHQQQEFAALDADICVVIAYGLILPKAVLVAPRLGCVNAHASLLPSWRGAAPIQRAIMAGDKETGVCIMQMDAGLDTGAVLRAAREPIDEGCDAGQLHDRLATLSARLLTEVAEELCQGVALTAIPQDVDAGVSYAAKIKKSEARLDWREGAEGLARRVRALSPYPGAWFMHGEERIKLRAATALPYVGDVAAGTVLRNIGPFDVAVACGSGTALGLVKLQRSGKAILDAAEFLRGYKLAAGEALPCPATS